MSKTLLEKVYTLGWQDAYGDKSLDLERHPEVGYSIKGQPFSKSELLMLRTWAEGNLLMCCDEDGLFDKLNTLLESGHYG